VQPLLLPLGHISDMMLVCRKGTIEKILSLCYSIVYYYNGAQRYEQFLQGRLYQAFILLGLALSSKCLCVFGLHGAVYIIFFLLTSFSLSFSELSLVGLSLDMVD